MYRAGKASIYPESNEIELDGSRTQVEPKVMQLLCLLCEHAGEVIPRETLVQEVWQGAFVSDDAVNTAICALRRALRDKPARPEYIETVPKRGYRLIAAVRKIQPGQSLPATERDFLYRSRCLRQEETASHVRQAFLYSSRVAVDESGCASAHAEQALSAMILEKMGSVSRAEAEPLIRQAMDAALTLDEGAACAQLCRAKFLYIYEWRWAEAEVCFQRGLSCEPDNADVAAEYGLMLTNMRRFGEARQMLQRSLQTDPLSPSANTYLGHVSFFEGDYSAAIRQYRRLLRISPAHLFARWCLAAAYEHAGMSVHARAAAERGLHLLGRSGIPLLVTKARVHALRGDRDRAAEAVHEIGRCTKDPLLLAHVFCGIGRIDEAVPLLECAADQRHYRMCDLNVIPGFRLAREHSRAKAILRHMQLSH